jgi:hypothetical protein
MALTSSAQRSDQKSAAGLLPLTSLDGWNRLAMTNDRAGEEGKITI